MSDHNSQRSATLVALVVEDEPLLRMEAADFISEIGFDVLETDNAASALTHFERHDDIALLFIDVRMPGEMDGLALAHAVALRWPHTQIIVCTAVRGIHQTMLPDNAMFFDKPYLHAKVIATIRRAKNDRIS